MEVSSNSSPHISSHDVCIQILSSRSQAPAWECIWQTFFPAIVPSLTVRTGKIFRDGRVWCMFDTLFVSKTISQARDLSKKRMGNL
jgi:hypothetical protein